MRNVIIWGLEKRISCHALKSLEQQSVISIKAWFGERKESKLVTHNWLELVFKGFNGENLMECDEEIYQKVYQQRYVIMDTLSRAFYFQNKPMQEYLNVINLLIRYFYGLIKQNKVDYILFDDAPHDAPNYILYCLAKAMELDVLIVSQSLFPNRFFYLDDLNDFGWFDSIPSYNEVSLSVTIEKNCEKEWFYMKKPTFKERIAVQLKKIKHFSKWKTERITIWKNSARKYEGFSDFVAQRIAGRLLEKRYESNYKMWMKEYFADALDLSEKFIYFPLHMQPEMTTSVLGGIYCDQLLAIERLSKWIPDGWFIYVKENPKQTSFMRGEQFFRRIKVIPKVKGIANHFSTFELTKKSQFVATITGTAGWEAISSGKNVVIFGEAWYRNLPGVFDYRQGVSFQDVVNYKIDYNELENKVAELMKKMGAGIVNQDFLEVFPDYNEEENNQQLYEFFNYAFRLPSKARSSANS